MRIYSDGNQVRKNIRRNTEVVASYCEKSVPTEKAREHFKRKAYWNEEIRRNPIKSKMGETAVR